MDRPFRQKKLYKQKFIIILFLFTSATGVYSAEDGETSLFRSILSCHEGGNARALRSTAWKFLKRYPKSSRVPDVRFYMAENESDSDRAIDQYMRIARYYPHFRKGDFVYYRICQISFLKSDWKGLASAAEKAVVRHPRSPLKSEFLLYQAQASIKTGNLQQGEKICLEVQKNDHRSRYMARSLFLLAVIQKKKSGYSRGYIYSLREILQGFPKSEIFPSALFLTGEFYLHHGDRNRAYTAFSDLVAKFPGCLESAEARKHLKELKKSNPVRTAYFPDRGIINKTTDLDISPEHTLPEKKTKDCFTVAVGPMHTRKNSSRIYHLIKGYGKIKSFKTRLGYTHYLGCRSTPEGALSLKIRLAEELGINGNIARIDNTAKGNFIYGEER